MHRQRYFPYAKHYIYSWPEIHSEREKEGEAEREGELYARMHLIWGNALDGGKHTHIHTDTDTHSHNLWIVASRFVIWACMHRSVGTTLALALASALHLSLFNGNATTTTTTAITQALIIHHHSAAHWDLSVRREASLCRQTFRTIPSYRICMVEGPIQLRDKRGHKSQASGRNK